MTARRLNTLIMGTLGAVALLLTVLGGSVPGEPGRLDPAPITPQLVIRL